MSIAPSAPPPGAVPLDQRSLAPDLARGLMLLLIAVAHAHMCLSGEPAARRGQELGAGAGGVLRRRSLWLLAFGFCHALLLFFGDILGAYGLVGLLLNPVAAMVMRVIGWAAMAPTYFAVSVVPAFLFGIWVARRRLLDEPGAHRASLSRIAVIGTGVSAAGGRAAPVPDDHRPGRVRAPRGRRGPAEALLRRLTYIR
ncbi:hypothetical protein [Nonomuraea sp. 10N515B]|uniref:hypothetical protein n=1 Tax=Nonomuraea sp. 10N515B TaxID=3457422 RepID=UPI003FCE5AFF